MLVEPLTGSGKIVSQPVKAGPPSEQDTAQKDDQVKKSVKAPNLSGLEELASDVQKNLNIIHNVDLHFTVHKASGRVVVTVTDKSTGEVIREIPSSELLAFVDKFDEMVGMIFDQRA
jgi:flagellar protein FlaG